MRSILDERSLSVEGNRWCPPPQGLKVKYKLTWALFCVSSLALVLLFKMHKVWFLLLKAEDCLFWVAVLILMCLVWLRALKFCLGLIDIYDIISEWMMSNL